MKGMWSMSAGIRGVLRYAGLTLIAIAPAAIVASFWPFLYWYLFFGALFCLLILLPWAQSLLADWRKLYSLGLTAADMTASRGFPPYAGTGCVIMKMQRDAVPRMIYIIITHDNASCMYQGWNLWNQEKVPEARKVMKRSIKHRQVA
jgi:hypothetical protein